MVLVLTGRVVRRPCGECDDRIGVWTSGICENFASASRLSLSDFSEIRALFVVPMAIVARRGNVVIGTGGRGCRNRHGPGSAKSRSGLLPRNRFRPNMWIIVLFWFSGKQCCDHAPSELDYDSAANLQKDLRQRQGKRIAFENVIVSARFTLTGLCRENPLVTSGIESRRRSSDASFRPRNVDWVTKNPFWIRPCSRLSFSFYTGLKDICCLYSVR